MVSDSLVSALRLSLSASLLYVLPLCPRVCDAHINGVCFALRGPKYLAVPEVTFSAPAGSKATPSDRTPWSCKTQLRVVCEGAGGDRCGGVSPMCQRR